MDAVNACPAPTHAVTHAVRIVRLDLVYRLFVLSPRFHGFGGSRIKRDEHKKAPIKVTASSEPVHELGGAIVCRVP